MKQKSLILMSTLLVCQLESFAQSDVEKNDSIWKDFDLASVTVVASKPLVKMETDKMTYNVQQMLTPRPLPFSTCCARCRWLR